MSLKQIQLTQEEFIQQLTETWWYWQIFSIPLLEFNGSSMTHLGNVGVNTRTLSLPPTSSPPLMLHVKLPPGLHVLSFYLFFFYLWKSSLSTCMSPASWQAWHLGSDTRCFEHYPAHAQMVNILSHERAKSIGADKSSHERATSAGQHVT